MIKSLDNLDHILKQGDTIFIISTGAVEPYLFPYEWHHTDASEHVLSWQTLPRDAVSKRLGSVGPRLTKVTHEQRHIGPAKKAWHTE